MIEFVNSEAVVGLAGLSLILFWLIVGNVRGWYVPGPTHRREMAVMQAQVDQAIKDRDKGIKDAREDRDKGIHDARDEMTTRMDNFRGDFAVRMDQMRVDHEKQLEALVRVADGIRADFATTNESREAVFSVVLASKDRDIDGWRTAWMTADEAGNQEVITKLDTLLAGDETIRRWFQAFQDRTAPDNG